MLAHLKNMKKRPVELVHQLLQYCSILVNILHLQNQLWGEVWLEQHFDQFYCAITALKKTANTLMWKFPFPIMPSELLAISNILTSVYFVAGELLQKIWTGGPSENITILWTSFVIQWIGVENIVCTFLYSCYILCFACYILYFVLCVLYFVPEFYWSASSDGVFARSSQKQRAHPP